MPVSPVSIRPLLLLSAGGAIAWAEGLPETEIDGEIAAGIGLGSCQKGLSGGLCALRIGRCFQCRCWNCGSKMAKHAIGVEARRLFGTTIVVVGGVIRIGGGGFAAGPSALKLVLLLNMPALSRCKVCGIDAHSIFAGEQWCAINALSKGIETIGQSHAWWIGVCSEPLSVPSPLAS